MVFSIESTKKKKRGGEERKEKTNSLTESVLASKFFLPLLTLRGS